MKIKTVKVYYRPDFILVKKVNKIYLIDVTILQGYNVRKEQVAEEHNEQLKNEVNRIWKTKTKTKVVPVFIEATGIVTKNMRMYTNKVSNNIRH